MTTERFWVVGGDYTCTGFRQLRDGSGRVVGPFDSRGDAQAAWRRLSDETRSRATARFSVMSETLRLPA